MWDNITAHLQRFIRADVQQNNTCFQPNAHAKTQGPPCS